MTGDNKNESRLRDEIKRLAGNKDILELIERRHLEFNAAREIALAEILAAYGTLAEWGTIPRDSDLTDEQRVAFENEVRILLKDDPAKDHNGIPAYLMRILPIAWRKATEKLSGDRAASNTPKQVGVEASQQPKRGMKLGTAERVTEFHKLVKSGMSHNKAKNRSHCDPATYYHWCREVTGEDPIEPYR